MMWKLKPRLPRGVSPTEFATISWIAVGVVFVWLVFGFVPWAIADKAGEFGDSFGFVNSLFSGLALAGVIIAIWFQSKQIALQQRELRAQNRELRMTREELKLTRKEVAGSRKAQEDVQRTMHLTAYLNAAEARMNDLAKLQGDDEPVATFVRDRLSNRIGGILGSLELGGNPTGHVTESRIDAEFAILNLLNWARVAFEENGHDVQSANYLERRLQQLLRVYRAQLRNEYAGRLEQLINVLRNWSSLAMKNRDATGRLLVANLPPLDFNTLGVALIIQTLQEITEKQKSED